MEAVDLILESFVFLLIGLQLPSVVNGLQGYSTSIVVWASVAVLVTVVVVRIAWVFPFTYVPRWLSPRIRAREPEISRGRCSSCRGPVCEGSCRWQLPSPFR